MFLYISDQPRKSRAIVDALSSLGFLPIRSDLQGALQSLEENDVSAAVIDCIPDLKAGEALCRRLRAQTEEN